MGVETRVEMVRGKVVGMEGKSCGEKSVEPSHDSLLGI